LNDELTNDIIVVTVNAEDLTNENVGVFTSSTIYVLKQSGHRLGSYESMIYLTYT
jgi:hypothetical protein